MEGGDIIAYFHGSIKGTWFLRILFILHEENIINDRAQNYIASIAESNIAFAFPT